MKKITFPILMLLVLSACEKDALQNDISNHSFEQKLNLNTPDQVFSYLASEVPEQYDDAEIDRLRQMLEGTSTKREDLKRSNNTIELPAGSSDALQVAIDEAGPGGTVLVKTGTHTETGLIVVDHRVNIIGEDGAQIDLGNSIVTEVPIQFSGGLHISNADRSIISNIHFHGGNGAGLGVFIEESDRLMISNNIFTNLQFSIVANHADHLSLRNNVIEQQIPELLEGARGIIIINGKSASIVQNTVSGTLFGIWACDKGGLSWGNNTHGNFYGQIVCKFPAALINSNGDLVGSDSPGNHWLVALNEASNNFYAGYVVIDGAQKNTLLANRGSGNAAYDIDLVGDSERFGFLTPTSVKNRVITFNNLIVKDCGEDNKVIGGTLVDTNSDPCL